jgi:hypothetical protein
MEKECRVCREVQRGTYLPDLDPAVAARLGASEPGGSWKEYRNWKVARGRGFTVVQAKGTLGGALWVLGNEEPRVRFHQKFGLWDRLRGRI